MLEAHHADIEVKICRLVHYSLLCPRRCMLHQRPDDGLLELCVRIENKSKVSDCHNGGDTLLQHVARELWLVDIKLDRRDGQVRDLADVAAVVASATKSPGAGATVRAATHHEVAAECDIIVITAGSKYTIGTSLPSP